MRVPPAKTMCCCDSCECTESCSGSENKLQAKLQLAGSRCCSGDDSEVSRYIPAFRSEDDQVIRYSKVGPIEEIKHLSTELNRYVLSDLRILKDSKIKRCQARAIQNVTTRVSIRAGRRQRKSRRIDVVIRVARNRAGIGSARYDIRSLRYVIGRSISCPVKANNYVEGKPAARSK